jgi:predicted MPP superfamily phosphohydrolase
MPSPLAFTIFFVVSTALISLFQYYLYRRFVKYLSIPQAESWYSTNLKRIALVIFIAANVPYAVIYFMRVLNVVVPDLVFTIMLYPFAIWQGGTLGMFIGLMIGKLFKYLFKFGKTLMRKIVGSSQVAGNPQPSQQPAFDPSRRKFVNAALYGVAAYSFGGSLYGVLTRDNYEVVHTTIAIKNLPERLKGLTIGLISDIHSGVYMSKRQMDEYVRAVNDLQADIIMVPGDFVNSMTEEVYPLAESFSNLKARFGVFGCLGNHDFFARDVDKISKELEQCGIHLLRNDHELLTINGEPLYLIGVDDRHENIDAAMKGITNDSACGIKILLCHKPYFFDRIHQRGIDLMLAGHTHGGQIVFAKFPGMDITPAALTTKYIAGHYLQGNSHLYVSRGIGTVGLPIRLNCPAEVTKITLA